MIALNTRSAHTALLMVSIDFILFIIYFNVRGTYFFAICAVLLLMSAVEHNGNASLR